jgi:sugar phosphate permease
MSQNNHRIYYGWYIAGIAFIAFFLSTGTGFYAFNAMLEPLCRLRGWSRTDINLALVIGTVFSFICQYAYGSLLHKTGIRVLMCMGSIVAGLAFMCIPRAMHLWQFYFCYTILFIGNGAYGGIVSNTVVNNWFFQKRGKALGLATSGMSLSGAVLPFGVLLLIHAFGLPNATLIIGLMMMAFGPMAWFTVRDWPEDMGLGPDGILVESGGPQNRLDQIKNTKTQIPHHENQNLKALLTNSVFWKIGMAFALLMIGTVGVMSQLKPRFSDIGYSPMAAMMMMGLTALTGAIGKYVWGSLCDRFNIRHVASIMAAFNAIGLGWAMVENSNIALFAFIILYGFSMGGTMSVYPVMIAGVFGRKNFAFVLKFISVFLAFQFIGYVIAGMSFDLTGSYDAAYLIFFILDVMAAMILFSINIVK